MKKFLVINFIVFQLCWLVAATYQQQGVIIFVILLAIHFFFSPSKSNDIKVLTLAFIGCCVDQLLLSLHVFEFNGSPSIIPLWLILLWYSFALCFNHSLNWLLHVPPGIQALLGAVFGSFSYYLALQFSAFTSSLSLPYFIVTLSLVWTFLLPLLVIIHKKFIVLDTSQDNDSERKNTVC